MNPSTNVDDPNMDTSRDTIRPENKEERIGHRQNTVPIRINYDVNNDGHNVNGDMTNFKLCLLSCIAAKNTSDQSAAFMTGRKNTDGLNNQQIRENFIKNTLGELITSPSLSKYHAGHAVNNNLTKGLYNIGKGAYHDVAPVASWFKKSPAQPIPAPAPVTAPVTAPIAPKPAKTGLFGLWGGRTRRKSGKSRKSRKSRKSKRS